ncbi:MAG: aminotransferase [Alphaproteobacteria bacterium]|nr:aminotransferase [Alphaproteobacteria bacterium]
MNPIFASLPTTIFDVMSGLARETGAINLGQGFPEEDGPLDVREAAAAAILAGPNQYPPMRGLPGLREAVAEHYARLGDVALDWRTEVTITSGATEAIAASLLAVVSPGDEVVVFEPMYDAYAPLIARAGGTPKPVRLSPPRWTADATTLAAAFSSRTRAVVLNTPLNPTASVFNEAMLARIAALCVAHDAIAISDEVWEHVTFDGVRHRSMLSAPGMRERAIKIGSAGKIFSMTGWKVGFVCAAPALTEVVAKAHQFLTFTTPPHLQSAVAYGLGKPAVHFDAMREGYARSRARVEAGLRQEGFVTLPCEGTYFLNVDLRASGIALDDADFAIRALKEAGVATIPLSAFYAAGAEKGYVRLCFAKRDETLDRGIAALAKTRRLFA